MKREDPRPKEYRYWNQLLNHLGGDTGKLFNGEFVWPRQFEIHLPGNHKYPCELACRHCAGSKFDKTLGTWEREGLELLNNLKGAIPYHIYGGAYTEPLLNPYYMAFLNTTKKYNNHFGIHTNGVLLNMLEEKQGWLTELNRIATDDIDYLSVSIDAGFPWSWARTKGVPRRQEQFYQVIEGVRKACKIREKHGKTHAIRLCYLISPHSGNINDFLSIISLAKDIGVDSLRFSIPFGNYNQDFDKIREYKEQIEIPGDEKYYNLLKPYLSSSQDERPYIFYTGPEFTDIEKFDGITKCAYGYYQITYGADGYVYRCSTVATPTGKQCRLGKITANLDEFKKMIMRNCDPKFNCAEQCFAKGLRCNRMGLEINRLAVGLEL